MIRWLHHWDLPSLERTTPNPSKTIPFHKNTNSKQERRKGIFCTLQGLITLVNKTNKYINKPTGQYLEDTDAKNTSKPLTQYIKDYLL